MSKWQNTVAFFISSYVQYSHLLHIFKTATIPQLLILFLFTQLYLASFLLLNYNTI